MKLHISVRKKLSARIIKLRKKSNMSQEELAYAAGLAKSTVSDLENCKGDITLSTLEAIASALYTTSSDLLNYSAD